MTKSKIHIVDDDASIRDSLSCLLMSMHYNVSAYESGHVFFETYSKVESECLILDLAMPHMGGQEVFNQIQQRQLNLPCIFISGHATVNNAVDTIERGAITFLVKPFDCEKLLKAVEKALHCCHALRTHSTLQDNFSLKLESLTPKQLQILKLMLKNYSIDDMAKTMRRSLSTIEKHRMAVLDKLEFSNTQKLIIFCHQHGFNIIDGLLTST